MLVCLQTASSSVINSAAVFAARLCPCGDTRISDSYSAASSASVLLPAAILLPSVVFNCAAGCSAVAAAHRHDQRRSRTAKNGAQAVCRSGGTACCETRRPSTGTGTRRTRGTSGTGGTRDDAPGTVRAPKSRETLARCDGAAGCATGGCGGGAGTSAGSRAGTCSRAVFGARPPIGRRRSTSRGQASGGARR